jgi:metal-responsive CopG/Arc/MetJ family transcriptional regulator
MKRFTVSIPKELKEKLNAMPDINWPEVAREGVVEKLSKLEKFEKLENEG